MGEALTLADAPHCASAVQYARDVLAGRIAACHWVRQACQRQIDDLQYGPERGLEFRYAEAERVCDFIELLPHVKGRWARKSKTIDLEPWQRFILTTVFGWYQEDDDSVDGWVRRFRSVYIEVGRKNAKTTISSGVGLYMGFVEGEAGSEVYSAATGHDQARIAFDLARLMAKSRHSAGFRNRFGVEVRAHNLCSVDQASKFEPLSADAKGLDGKNPHCAIIDEYHAHKTPAVYAALETGMGAREQPLMWAITTAGTDRSGPCYATRTYVTKVLDNVLKDDSYFGIIYTLDGMSGLNEEGGDDWTDPAVWVKANPNLGVSVFEKDLQQQCSQAKEEPLKQAAFLTKRLNVWVSADQRWMNMQWWDECGEPFDINDFRGEPCYVGLDLASRDDVAAMMLVWERGGHVYTKGRYFLPRDVVMEKAHSTHAHYAGWAAENRFTLTPGNIIDYEAIQQEILDLPSRGFAVKEVCYDPFHATQIATSLSEQGVTVVEIRANVLNFSEPMKELAAMVKTGQFHHGGDPVLTWMASNVVGHYDRKDNIYPAKERAENKIDGIIGVLLAMNRIMRVQKPRASKYGQGEKPLIVG